MIDINEIRQKQHDILAWHIYDWRIHDEIYKNYGNHDWDSNYAWAVMDHYENNDGSPEWLEQEEDFDRWREYLTEEYKKYALATQEDSA